MTLYPGSRAYVVNEGKPAIIAQSIAQRPEPVKSPETQNNTTVGLLAVAGEALKTSSSYAFTDE